VKIRNYSEVPTIFFENCFLVFVAGVPHLLLRIFENWHTIFFSEGRLETPMKKIHEINISGAALVIYDILQRVIEILVTKQINILEIGQSEITDTNGNMTILLTMVYEYIS
jgi:hypothetical protein